MDDRAAELTEYSKFYLEHVPRLIAFLIYQGLSLTDAADCAQDTMIDALPPVWATLHHPYAWCRLVAHRKAIALRARSREIPIAQPCEGIGRPLINPSAQLEEFERHHEFLFWLRQLGGDRQRQVMAWTYDGATPAETAEALYMTPATVRSTIRNARY
jgi:DNA-directed RNA polymerase specialized sigma24 family protein